jgi:hypothetical protein
MPDTDVIDPDRRLVTATGTGPCDLKAALAKLRELVADPAFGPGFRVLLELRAADYTPTAREAEALANCYAAPAGRRGHRLARVVDLSIRTAPAPT